MVLSILKTKQPILIFLIPLVTVLLWLHGFLNIPNEIPYNEHIQAPLYNLIMPLIKNVYVSKIIGIILLVAQSFLLASLNMKFFFIKQRTYLHTFLFVLIVSSSTSLQYTSPALIANFFIIFAFDWLFASYKKYNTNKQLFNTGLLLSVATLFYYNTAILLPFFIIGYFILHTVRFREILILILGFTAPLIIFSEIAFLQGNLFVYTHNILSEFKSFNYNFNFFSTQNFFYIWFIIMTLVAVFSFLRIVTSKKIVARKIFSIFFIYILYLTTILFLFPMFDFQTLILLALPISYLITDFYINYKNNFISELSFVLLIVSLILTQFNW